MYPDIRYHCDSEDINNTNNQRNKLNNKPIQANRMKWIGNNITCATVFFRKRAISRKVPNNDPITGKYSRNKIPRGPGGRLIYILE